MKFRWKLRLLMLAVSILPIVILRTFGIHNVQTMADALSDEVQANRLAAARNDIHGILESCKHALSMERERMAMALFLLSDSLRRVHARNEERARLPALPAQAFQPPADHPLPRSHLCVVAPEMDPVAQRQAAGGIAAIQNPFRSGLGASGRPVA